MQESYYLSNVIGLVTLISGIAILLNVDYVKNAHIEISQSPALMLVFGIIMLIVGAILVYSHNVWQLNWQIVITIISWLVLLQGSGRIIFPKAFAKMLYSISESKYITQGMGFMLLLVGIFLIYCGQFKI